MEPRSRLEAIGAACAIAGGAMWVVKGGAILATGDQPPLLFELAGPLFAIALLGLHKRLDGRGGSPARVGLRLVQVGIAAMVVLAGYELAVSEPADIVTSLLIALAALSTFVGLLLLGIAARRTAVLRPPWTSLPFIMGVAVFPALSVVGGLLAAIHERLLEVPLVAFGVAWVILGVALRTSRDPMPERAPAGPAPRLAG